MKSISAKKNIKKDTAFTLIEVLIVIAVISIAFLGIISGFLGIGKGLLTSKGKTLATSFAEEKMEELKNLSYNNLFATTQSDISSLGYDNTYFPPETYTIESIDYTRYVLIRKVREDNGSLVDISPNHPDQGLRRITITVEWTESGSGALKQYRITNVMNNPDRTELSGEIEGEVRNASTLNDISGALVYIKENPNLRETTDTAGEFSILVPTGTWNLKVTQTGYYDRVNGTYTVTQAAATSVPVGDLDLTPIQTGAIKGLVTSTASVPIEGAVVTCDDETSQPTVTVSTGVYGPAQNYLISNVSTGTWSVVATTGAPLNLLGNTTGVAVTAGSATTADILLDTATQYGSISGIVDMNDTGDDSGVKVSVGSSVDYTDVGGNYTLFNISTGVITVLANPNAYDPSYTTDSATVTVTLGSAAKASKITIEPAGSITGTIYATGGVDPYPGIVIVAEDIWSIERGVDVSDSNGEFALVQLPVANSPYSITPVIDVNESTCTPSSITAITVTKGGTDSGNDFEIASAWGYIEGTVREDSVPIESGVLIIASTGTIPSPPGDISLGETGKYGSMSYPDGTYRIKVRSTYSYNVYAWYTSISGSQTTTSRKSDTGIALSGAPPTATVDFDWP